VVDALCMCLVRANFTFPVRKVFGADTQFGISTRSH